MNSQSSGPITTAVLKGLNPLNQIAGDSIKPPSNRNLLTSVLESGEAGGGKVGLLKWRQDQINKANNYSLGGKIKGPGTATSDSIPAQVQPTGEPIRVSTDERIVSKEQDAVLEMLARELGFDSLDDLLRSGTGKAVGPTIKADTRTAANGLSPENNPEAITSGGQSNPLPGVIRSGNSFSQDLSAAQPAVSTPASTQAAPVIDKNGNNMAFTNAMKAQLGESPIAAATAPSPTIRDKFGNDMTQTNAMKAQLGESPISGNPLNSYKPVISSDPFAMAKSQQSGTQPGAQERLFAVGNALPSSASPLAAQTAPTTTQPQSTASIPASTPYVDGSQAIKPANPLASVAPFSARNGNSFTERNTVEDKSNPLTSINMTANNESMARANAIRQSMVDGDGAGPKVAMLGNSGRAESQALMDKWGREDQTREMMQEMGRNPKAAGAIASLMNTQQGNDTAREEFGNRRLIAGEETETRRQGFDVAMRGQDIEAKTRSEQLAGNPLANLLTQTKIDSERAGLDTTRQHNNTVAQLNTETDPTKRQALIENLQAAHGKASTSTERLTLPMMRSNQEIEKARQAVGGLSPDDIRRKTAKQTDTGRDNPDFDAELETAVKLANRRKIGTDDWFDQRQSDEQKPQRTGGDVMARFKADPAMKGHTPGKQTANGTEVLDSTGKLIGYYQ